VFQDIGHVVELQRCGRGSLPRERCRYSHSHEQVLVDFDACCDRQCCPDSPRVIDQALAMLVMV
jgi:hypothetical protein